MKINLKNIVAATLVATLAGCAVSAKEPVDYVNPYIGSISHLLVPCFPTIQLPNSLMRIYPSRGDYVTEYLDGLPIVVTNHRERSAFRLSITQSDALRPIIRTSWDHERVTPYDYQVQIADNTHHRCTPRSLPSECHLRADAPRPRQACHHSPLFRKRQNAG